MDSLIIQDAFEPYYCDRKPFAVSKPRKRWIKPSSTPDEAGSGPSRSEHQNQLPADGGTAAED